MNKYSEEYRGRTIRVLRDDSHPVVKVDGGNAYLTVAQARRSVDHFVDRSCAAHGRLCDEKRTWSELREHGAYAGVALAARVASLTAARVFPTREGRWGIRQLHNGEPTGGGTIGLGWESREAAEAANPPVGGYTFEAYPRWGDES